jgi:hypothetical protein
MWISKEERRLLRGYYDLLGGIGVEEAFRIDDLGRLLTFWGHRKKVPKYEDAVPVTVPVAAYDTLKCAIRSTIQNRFRIKKANDFLVARNLIKITPHDSGDGVIIISLTLDGYDLGKKYSGWLAKSGLWFEEYRNHWLWLFFAIVGGGLVSKLVESIWVRLVKD